MTETPVDVRDLERDQEPLVNIDTGEVLSAPRQDMSIHKRLAMILREMPAIGKTQKNVQQGFMFRGHDDVMNALNPLLSKYEVFVVPNVLERVTGQRTTTKGGVLYEVNLHVAYTFYGPQGDRVTASAWGEGTDSGDKSTNKAMTMALKNVLAQTFAVSTEELSAYDTDASSDEPTKGRVQERDLRWTPPSSWKQWVERLKAIDKDAGWDVWLDQASTAVYGVPKNELPKAVLGDELWKQSLDALKRLETTLAGRDTPPPNRLEIALAFSGAFGLVDDSVTDYTDGYGDLLPGPPWRLSPDEDLPTKQEYGAAAKEGDGEAGQKSD